MARNATAIYIDDSAIRVLTMSGKRPQKWVAEPLEPGLVRDGMVIDQQEVAKRIRHLWGSQGIGTRKVIAGISGANSLYRTLTLPQLPRNLMDEAVRREAGRALGIPVDQVYISWQELPRSRPDSTTVYVTGAARSTVDSVVRTLRSAGLNPYLMDIRPLALARAAVEGNGLIVDLQETSVDVVVKMDNMPSVVRSVTLPRSDKPEERLTAVRQEIERAVTFYNSAHVDAPFPDEAPLLLSGQLGQREDLWEQLKGRRDRRVGALDSPTDSVEGFVSTDYATCVGLCLKESSGKGQYSVVDLNTLPSAYKPAPTPLSQLLYPPFLLVALAALAFGGYMLFVTMQHTEALREEYAVTSELAVSVGSEKSSELNALTARIEELKAQVSTQESRADSLEGLARRFKVTKDEINGDVGEIHSTPAGVNVTNVDHGIDAINITGSGATEEAVFTYARQLRSSGRFELVVLSSVRSDGVGCSFDMVLYK